MEQAEKKTKIKVGLLMDSFAQPAWVYRMLSLIQQSEYAEISLVILNDAPPASHKGAVKKFTDNYDSLLFVGYRALENTLFKPQPNAFKNYDTNDLLSGIPVIKAIPRQTKNSDFIEGEALEKIQSAQLDVMVRLGFRILRGGILTAAKYGIWSYHHGDNFTHRGMPAGWFEVLNHHPVTGSILQVITEDLDNGDVLYRSWSCTDHLTINRNRNNFYWKSLAFLPRKLAELQRDGEAKFQARVARTNEHPGFYSERLYTSPTNREMAKMMWNHWTGYVKRRVDVFLFPEQQWTLMYDLRHEMSTSFWRFKKLTPPKGTFWADPFLVYRDNKYFIFFEDLDFSDEKGTISVLEMDEKGNTSTKVKVLERPYHLSYPFILEWEGETFMIPETSQNHTIEVYRASRFPDQWELHKTLMNDVVGMDATFHEHNGKWWMFVNMQEHQGSSKMDELFLFWADSPLSDSWTPHPMNPIVSDVRSARPAGKLFIRNGKLYRPSQNSSGKYGYGLKINEVVTLNEEEYEEREISSIVPNWDPKITGLHTLNHEHHLTIIDAQRRRFRLFSK